MKIISKKIDYYDCIGSYGGYDIDDKIIYLRKSKKIKFKTPRLFSNNWEENIEFMFLDIEYSGKNYSYKINKKFIGFCGEIFPVLEFKLNHIGSYSNPHFEYIEYIYTLKQFEILIKKYPIKKFLERFYDENYKPFKWFSWDKQGLHIKKDYSNFFNLFLKENHNEIIIKWEKLFAKYNIPIFLIKSFPNKEINIITNPIISKFQFYKVYDPFTTFQKISQYISGVLGINNKVITTIADSDMLIKKGFDDKSFKTLSPGKKKKSKRIRKK